MSLINALYVTVAKMWEELVYKMKKIYILCDHGLGNRLASLIGGLTIAKRFNFLPIICWPTNNWCYAEFTDLFDLNFDLADNNFSQSIV